MIDLPTGRIQHLEPNLQNIPIRTKMGRRLKAAFSQNLLDSATRRGYAARMDETWADIPDLHGCEVSTAGRIRKWVTKKGRRFLAVCKGRTTRSGDVTYDLAGNSYTIDELMRWTFGEDAADDRMLERPGENRDLSQFEIDEIRQAEGHKPAFEVAEEFRIDSYRVRGLWDETR